MHDHSWFVSHLSSQHVAIRAKRTKSLKEKPYVCVFFLQLSVDKPITIHCIFQINSLFKPKEKRQTSETNLQRYCGSWRMQMSQGEQVN